MTNQQLADVLLAHWQLLWPLDPSERIRRIDAIRADYEQEEELHRVTAAVSSDPALRPSQELDFSSLEF